MKRGRLLAALIVATTVTSGLAQALAPAAHAKPAPEVEYLYNVAVRRHYNFPNGDAIAYGYRICESVSPPRSYAQLVDQVRSDVTPGDEAAVNYLISTTVESLCPAQIWQLRNSATGYVPREGWSF